MKIFTPQDFFPAIENNWLLLDTCAFIDASIHPAEFVDLFNQMKVKNVTLVTLEIVKAEFLKGVADTGRYSEKTKIVEEIVAGYLPVDQITINNSFDLIKKYLQDGKGLSITDLLLGATLFKYPGKVMLLTKNTTEFPQSIFQLKTCFNLGHNKGLHTYGIYTA